MRGEGYSVAREHNRRTDGFISATYKVDAAAA